jgi:hypothetical protein
MVYVSSTLTGIEVVSEADGERYESALRRWSENAEKRAKYVVFPGTPEEVARTVGFDLSLPYVVR